MTGVRRTLAGMVVLGLLAGCSSGGVKYEGKAVTEPEKFLASAEREWRSDLAKGRATTHKESRCYFSAPAEGGDIDPLLYCGPVRHFQSSGSGDNGIWDTYKFETFVLDSGVRLDDLDAQRRGAELGGGVQLGRPDGKTPPKDGDKLAAPPPPPVESGYLKTSTGDTAIKGEKKPKDGRIVTPRTTVTLTGYGTIDRIEGEDGIKGPADGEKFVVARFTTTNGPQSKAYGGWGSSDDLVDAEVAYALQIGSDRKPLKWESGGFGSSSEEGDSRTVIASIPKDADAQLVVTAAGKDQTLSLSTGERTSKVAELYYRGQTEVGVSRQYASQRYEKGDFYASVAALFTNVQFTPFDPVRGWAPDGRAWLRLDTDQVSSDLYYNYETVFQHAKMTTVKDQNGKTSADLTKDEAIKYDSDFKLEPVFEVDAAATKFTVTFKPIFTFVAEDSYFKPRSGSGTLKPLTFDVEFKQ